MPRGPRLDAPGALHHVMARGIERCKIFRSNKDRQDLLDRLAVIAPVTGTAVYAWSLSPNHFHLLVRTGQVGLSRVMRRLLTGYAVSFNRRHKRVGRLFQNRFKSVLIEEEPYFLELVRYLHLNPLRAGLVRSVGELDSYRWSGHSGLMGCVDRAWQDTEYVLRRFGGGVVEARHGYRRFVADGVSKGKRQDLVGGGLIRSIGGRENLGELRRGRERWAYDERILGSSEFVIEALEGAESAAERKALPPGERRRRFDRLMAVVAERFGVGEQEVIGGSRRKAVARCRGVVAYVGVTELGMTGVEVGRALNVSRVSVHRSMQRGKRLLDGLGLDAKELLRKGT